VQVPGLPDACVAIAASDASAAVGADGSLWLWGEGPPVGAPAHAPRRADWMPPGARFATVALSAHVGAATTVAGAVYVWGRSEALPPEVLESAQADEMVAGGAAAGVPRVGRLAGRRLRGGLPPAAAVACTSWVQATAAAATGTPKPWTCMAPWCCAA